MSAFKRLRGFADAWLRSADVSMRRAGLCTLLFLTQGRRQVVKGDLPRFFDLAIHLLPTSIDSLHSRGDTGAWTVGDENCSESDVYSLYRLTLTDETPAADWLLSCELLQTSLEAFRDPFFAVLEEKPAVLDGLSLLLLSEHPFVRRSAAILLREAVKRRCEAWLAAKGSVFFCLQRLFVAFAMGGTVETMGEEGKLMATMVKEVVRRGGTYPRPEVMNNRELLKVTVRKVETGETEDVRQYYDMKGIEEEEDGNGETGETGEMEENGESDESENGETGETEGETGEMSEEKEEQQEQEEESEELTSAKASKPRLLLRRVPNPFTLQDTLFLLGNLLTDRSSMVREAGLSIFESILNDLNAETILQYIVPFFLFLSLSLDAAASAVIETDQCVRREGSGARKTRHAADSKPNRSEARFERLHPRV